MLHPKSKLYNSALLLDVLVALTLWPAFGMVVVVQLKPMSAGMLLDMGIMNPTPGQTLTRRVGVQSDHMEDALTFMREGRAYVRIAHNHGQLRGQLVTPHCLDGVCVCGCLCVWVCVHILICYLQGLYICTHSQETSLS
jgi:hypothetical protein